VLLITEHTHLLDAGAKALNNATFSCLEHDQAKNLKYCSAADKTRKVSCLE